jgi:hypothetical protein
MGLYQDHFRFDDGLPDLNEVRAEAGRRLGGTGGIEALYAEGQTVVARSMLDPFTRPVVCAVLRERGGQYVGFDGEPRDARIPAWAHRPIREMAWSERMAVRYRWWAWLFGTARPR